jgi:hypothetical protein
MLEIIFQNRLFQNEQAILKNQTHSWVKRIQVCSNIGPDSLQKGNKREIITKMQKKFGKVK